MNTKKSALRHLRRADQEKRSAYDNYCGSSELYETFRFGTDMQGGLMSIWNDKMSQPEERADLTISLPVDLLHQLNVYAQTRRTKSDVVVERLIRHFLHFIAQKRK